MAGAGRPGPTGRGSGSGGRPAGDQPAANAANTAAAIRPGELVVEPAAEHESEVDGSDEELGRDRRIGVGPEVAAGDPALDHARHLRPAVGDDPGPERIADRRVARDLRQHRPDDRAPRRRGDRVERIAHRGLELGPGIADVGDVQVRAGETEDELQGEGLLGRPAPVDRPLADARPGRHMLEAQPGEALLDEQIARGIKDRLVGALAARPAGRSGARVGVVDRSRDSNRRSGVVALVWQPFC